MKKHQTSVTIRYKPVSPRSANVRILQLNHRYLGDKKKLMVIKTLDPDSELDPDSVEMLDPDPDSFEMLDPDSMNSDPQHRQYCAAKAIFTALQ
jgi:hypothetical protein